MTNTGEKQGGKQGKMRAIWSWLLKPSARYSLLSLTVGGFIVGVLFWGGFNTAMEATNTMDFCTTCHEMQDNVYQEYRHTIHFQNRTGVRATCSDCHVPKEWFPKIIRKIQASNELFHWALGSIDTPEKFDAKRLTLARNVWNSMKANNSRECRNCHTEESMNPEFQQQRSRNIHLTGMETGQTCIDCHKGISHKNVRDQVSADEIEKLEAPNPAFIVQVPQSYRDGLKRAEERDAAKTEKQKQDALASEAAQKARIEQAVAQALAKAKTTTDNTGQPEGATASGSSSGFGIDWANVQPERITVFYPGEASFEWVQSREHSGSRAFLRGGDRCSTCHAKEVRDMGTKIVSGEKLEPTPIPGKRPWIDVNIQAVHDEQNMYLRFEWEDAPHTPVPFVEGGKMDPANQVKIAFMLAGTGIERVEQAGCWTTCHHDSRSMPDARKVDPSKITSLEQNPPDAPLNEGLTKYIAETRTQIEIRGGDGPRGGGENVKGAEEIAALLQAGTFMDLVRARSGAEPENGHVLAQRLMEGGAPIEAETALDAGRWTVTLKRPLKSDRPGDVSLEAGKLYTFGFAIHDDYTSARFHHVSVDLRLGLDNEEAEVNVRKK